MTSDLKSTVSTARSSGKSQLSSSLGLPWYSEIRWAFANATGFYWAEIGKNRKETDEWIAIVHSISEKLYPVGLDYIVNCSISPQSCTLNLKLIILRNLNYKKVSKCANLFLIWSPTIGRCMTCNGICFAWPCCLEADAFSGRLLHSRYGSYSLIFFLLIIDPFTTNSICNSKSRMKECYFSYKNSHCKISINF